MGPAWIMGLVSWEHHWDHNDFKCWCRSWPRPISWVWSWAEICNLIGQIASRTLFSFPSHETRFATMACQIKLYILILLPVLMFIETFQTSIKSFSNKYKTFQTGIKNFVLLNIIICQCLLDFSVFSYICVSFTNYSSLDQTVFYPEIMSFQLLFFN